MMILPLFIGFHTSQVVQDFVHQQYLQLSWAANSEFEKARWGAFQGWEDLQNQFLCQLSLSQLTQMGVDNHI